MSSYSANLKPLSIFLSYVLALNAETLPQTIERVLPSVVKIKVQRSEPQNEENELISIDAGGSGFVLDNNHHIVTNTHVIGDAKKIIIADQYNNEYPAYLVGKDDKTDIAVLESKSFNAPLLEEASSIATQIGEKVFAIGSPYSLSHTTSYGIVSAMNRFLPNYPYVTFIQTDAAINPGNSGGPLFNEKGQLIGMNSTYFSKQGSFTNIGFAIPIKDVHRISDRLIESKKIQRGNIGAELVISERYARKMGYQNAILVSRITSNSPSDKAGLLPGDLIFKINNQELKDGGELHRIMEQSQPNDTIKIRVSRNKEIIELTIKMDDSAIEIKENTNAGTNDAAEKLGMIVAERKGGLEIITTHSIAKNIGLMEKDRVLEINGIAIIKISDLNTQLTKLKDLDLALLSVERNNKKFTLPIGSKNALKMYSYSN